MKSSTFFGTIIIVDIKRTTNIKNISILVITNVKQKSYKKLIHLQFKKKTINRQNFTVKYLLFSD